MNGKRAVQVATVTTLAIASLLLNNCAKERNPVSAVQSTLPVKTATVTTPGLPMYLAAHNDTIYVADNQEGLARIRFGTTPTLITPQIRNHPAELVWVGYDSVNARAVVGAKTGNTSYADQMWYQRGDSLFDWGVTTLSGAYFVQLYTEPADSLRAIKCHGFGDGFNLYTFTRVYDEILGTWTNVFSSPSPSYKPVGSRSKVRHVIREGQYDYCSSDEYGLVVLNQVDERTPPSFLGQVDLPGSAYWSAKVDTIVYVALDQAGVAAVSVANPAAPRLLGVTPIAGSSRLQRLVVSEDKRQLFVMDNNDGVYCFTIPTPGTLAYQGLIRLTFPHFMLVYRNHLIVADEGEGVTFYRL